MLDIVKISLRITNPYLDDEVIGLIESAKLDLSNVGIIVDDEDNNALVNRAIITYCKANFGYDNPEAERFQLSYDMLKRTLAMSGGYREV